MKKTYKNIIFSLLTLSLMFISVQFNMVEAATVTPVKPQVQTYLSVSPIDVVDCPAKYLNKNITFSAEFVSFSGLGLDYKPAFRDSSKYIGVLIKRPDVVGHDIPLSELKMFMTRELAEKNIDIEKDDKVKITGKVFSMALGDPWMDITSFEILTQKKKANKK